MALMKANELLATMPMAIANDLLEYTFAEDKPVYRATLQAVAQARKVRPVYLERQPRTERHQAMLVSLSRPALLTITDNLIRNWLMKKHAALLADFLDTLKVPHEKGVVENVPPSVEDAVLQNAVDTVLAKYPAEVVAIYLHAFSNMEGVHWPNLELLLVNDTRLELKRG